jgi:uncharacterized protein
MPWTWDPRKAAANRSKHGVSLALASLVFDDPLHLSQPDPHPDGDRWQTIGYVGPSCLFVVHRWAGDDAESRLISACRATPRERRAYEEIS